MVLSSGSLLSMHRTLAHGSPPPPLGFGDASPAFCRSRPGAQATVIAAAAVGIRRPFARPPLPCSGAALDTMDHAPGWRLESLRRLDGKRSIQAPDELRLSTRQPNDAPNQCVVSGVLGRRGCYRRLGGADAGPL